jgi:hypothetical protein
MRRGNRLEAVAIDILREERPDWTITANPIPGGEFYRHLESGMSCTPDAFAIAPSRKGRGTCQIKTVDPYVFKKDWTVDGQIQVPLYVALQTIQEAALTKASWSCVVPLVGFNLDFNLLEVPLHEGALARIRAAVPDSLRRVRDNDPPPLIMPATARRSTGSLGRTMAAKLICQATSMC